MHDIIPVIEKMDKDGNRIYVCYLEDEKEQFVPEYPNDYPIIGESIARIAQRKLDSNPESKFVLKLQGYFPSILPVIALLMLNYNKNFCLKFDTKKFDQRWDGIIRKKFIHDEKTKTQTIKLLQRLCTLQTQETITEFDKRTLFEKAKKICTKQMYRVQKQCFKNTMQYAMEHVFKNHAQFNADLKNLGSLLEQLQKIFDEKPTLKKPTPPESVSLRGGFIG